MGKRTLASILKSYGLMKKSHKADKIPWAELESIKSSRVAAGNTKLAEQKIALKKAYAEIEALVKNEVKPKKIKIPAAKVKVPKVAISKINLAQFRPQDADGKVMSVQALENIHTFKPYTARLVDDKVAPIPANAIVTKATLVNDSNPTSAKVLAKSGPKTKTVAAKLLPKTKKSTVKKTVAKHGLDAESTGVVPAVETPTVAAFMPTVVRAPKAPKNAKKEANDNSTISLADGNRQQATISDNKLSCVTPVIVKSEELPCDETISNLMPVGVTAPAQVKAVRPKRPRTPDPVTDEEWAAYKEKHVSKMEKNIVKRKNVYEKFEKLAVDADTKKGKGHKKLLTKLTKDNPWYYL